MYDNSITGIHGQRWRQISGEYVGYGFRPRIQIMGGQGDLKPVCFAGGACLPPTYAPSWSHARVPRFPKRMCFSLLSAEPV